MFIDTQSQTNIHLHIHAYTKIIYYMVFYQIFQCIKVGEKKMLQVIKLIK
jgi:hypothetical protein